MYLKKLVFLFYLLVSTFIILEILFIVLPVSDSLKIMPVNDSNPFIHFEPNRTIKRAVGHKFNNINLKRINDYGYFSNNDFFDKNNNEKIVVIGDSYVEASQVSNNESVHGQLDYLLPNNFDVYGIGISGSPLSQYLAFTKMAKKYLNPKIYIYVIIENDFDRYLLKYKNSPGLHFFDDNYNLKRIDSEPSLIKKILRNSSFFRYLIIDFKISQKIKYLLYFYQNENNEINQDINILEKKFYQRISESTKVIDMFFYELKSIIKDTPVIFLIDGNRRKIYDNSNTNVEFLFEDMILKIFRDKCFNQKKYCIDMNKIFGNHYSINKEKFEFDNDWHWNKLAHELAAINIKKTIYDQKLIDLE